MIWGMGAEQVRVQNIRVTLAAILLLHGWYVDARCL